MFDELRTPLLRYLAGLGLRPQEGEEVAQETFLALLLHLRSGKPRDNLHGWVFRVGHNLGLKLRQRHEWRASGLPESATATGDNPEQRAASEERLRRMDAVLSALPIRDRACLSLRAEGLRYREIAAALGISVGSVAASMARALDRLDRAGVR